MVIPIPHGNFPNAVFSTTGCCPSRAGLAPGGRPRCQPDGLSGRFHECFSCLSLSIQAAISIPFFSNFLAIPLTLVVFASYYPAGPLGPPRRILLLTDREPFELTPAVMTMHSLLALPGTQLIVKHVSDVADDEGCALAFRAV